ncbi:MAG: hypothetical protein JO164_13455, partial [Candidatus Eremiobacteraeota bacterium]|nr:hypothetical protein [Candidatus Eremiobacteraeota bacterium]
MISRTTVVGALVVAELAIIGMAAQAIAGDGPSLPPLPASLASDHAASDNVVDKSFVTGPVPHVVVDVNNLHVIVQTGSPLNVRV